MRYVIQILSCLLLALVAGCMGRPQSATDAEDAALKRVENFAKNQRLIVGGYRAAYIEEAKGHVETKKDWSIERIDNQVKAGVKFDGTPVTPADIKDGYADVYAKRDAALLRVAMEVEKATEAQVTAEKDLSNARRLWAGVRTYDETPAITADAIPSFIELLTPLVESEGKTDAE
jgi:hypothetical protein